MCDEQNEYETSLESEKYFFKCCCCPALMEEDRIICEDCIKYYNEIIHLEELEEEQREWEKRWAEIWKEIRQDDLKELFRFRIFEKNWWYTLMSLLGR